MSTPKNLGHAYVGTGHVPSIRTLQALLARTGTSAKKSDQMSESKKRRCINYKAAI